MKPSEDTLTAPQQSELDDWRWRAILGRNREMDGRFYYAVSTTGIYCRPSCPARRPRQEHVSFHATCTDAESAGFRPCKRCRPDGLSPDGQQQQQIARACRFIEQSEQIPSLAALADHVGSSAHHLHRLFKQATGVTPRQYALACREKRLRACLESESTITSAIFNAGYNTSSRFYENADETLGMSPRRFRAGGAGEDIRHACGTSSLGIVLVAQSSKGVCAILLGTDADALRADLQKRFPRATLQQGDAEFSDLVARAVRFVDAPGSTFDLPLDIRGTAFQRRVWQRLREIPAGTTISYTELARSVGAPGAVRAVASACAANPIAVAVPCHRVVRNDGGLAGYRWGLERKTALLKAEAGKEKDDAARDEEIAPEEKSTD